MNKSVINNLYKKNMSSPSFFALVGTELCTSSDINRHNEERYIPINIVDTESKQIIGILMMYIEESKDYLIVRGFNIRKETYEKYDINSITETMIDFVKDFAIQNNYKKVYIPDNGKQHLISNFSNLTKQIKKISTENNSKKEDFILDEQFVGGRIGQEDFQVDKLFLLLDL